MKRFVFRGLREKIEDSYWAIVHCVEGDVYAKDVAAAKRLLERRGIKTPSLRKSRNMKRVDRPSYEIRKAVHIFSGYWGCSPLAYLVD